MVPATASCAPAKLPMPTTPTRKLARTPGNAGRTSLAPARPRNLTRTRTHKEISHEAPNLAEIHSCGCNVSGDPLGRLTKGGRHAHWHDRLRTARLSHRHRQAGRTAGSVSRP